MPLLKCVAQLVLHIPDDHCSTGIGANYLPTDVASIRDLNIRSQVTKKLLSPDSATCMLSCEAVVIPDLITFDAEQSPMVSIEVAPDWGQTKLASSELNHSSEPECLNFCLLLKLSWRKIVCMMIPLHVS